MSAPDFVASNHFTGTIAHLRRERRVVSRRFFRNAMALVEAAADFLACVAGMMAANDVCALISFDSFVQRPSPKAVAIGAAAGTIVVFLLRRDGIYKSDSGLLQIRETERTLRVAAQSLLLLLLVVWMLGLDISWPAIPIAVLLIPLLLVIEKQILFAIAEKLQPPGRMERVVAYGAGETVRRVLSTLLHSPRLGLLPVAVIDADPGQPQPRCSRWGTVGAGPFRSRSGLFPRLNCNLSRRIF